MSSEDREKLDISASFTVEDGVSSEALTAAVEELAGKEDFQTKLRRTDDNGKWFEIGNGSKYPTKQCIVLGDDDLIKEGDTYKRVTVKFKPGSKSGIEYSLGYDDFADAALKDIRKFRDMLKEKLAPEKDAEK